MEGVLNWHHPDEQSPFCLWRHVGSTGFIFVRQPSGPHSRLEPVSVFSFQGGCSTCNGWHAVPSHMPWKALILVRAVGSGIPSGEMPEWKHHQPCSNAPQQCPAERWRVKREIRNVSGELNHDYSFLRLLWLIRPVTLIDRTQNIHLLVSLSFTLLVLLYNHRQKVGSGLQPERFEMPRSPYVFEIVRKNFLSHLPAQEGSIWGGVRCRRIIQMTS